MNLVLRNLNKPIMLIFSTRFENGVLMTVEAYTAYRELTKGIEYQTCAYQELDAESAALMPFDCPLTESEVRSILRLTPSH
jgi:hypothetical protein